MAAATGAMISLLAHCPVGGRKLRERRLRCLPSQPSKKGASLVFSKTDTFSNATLEGSQEAFCWREWSG